MRIRINEEGKILFDEQEKKIDELNASVLEEIVRKSLIDEITYDLQGETPIAEMFREIEIKTKKGSEFRNEIEKLTKEIQKTADEQSNISDDTYLVK